MKIFNSDVFAVSEKLRAEKPCYLCARMRRGFLYERAAELGCNKIALGHHFDDVIETLLMGMLYSGQIQGMPPRFSGNDVLLSCALNLTQSDSIASQIPAGMKIHDGLICTGDQFITDRVDLDAIKERFSEGLAVDMESAAIAQVCYLYEIPFLSFRIISDTPGVDSHIQQYENFWGEMADRSFRITELFLNSLPEKI